MSPLVSPPPPPPPHTQSDYLKGLFLFFILFYFCLSACSATTQKWQDPLVLPPPPPEKNLSYGRCKLMWKCTCTSVCDCDKWIGLPQDKCWYIQVEGESRHQNKIKELRSRSWTSVLYMYVVYLLMRQDITVNYKLQENSLCIDKISWNNKTFTGITLVVVHCISTYWNNKWNMLS